MPFRTLYRFVFENPTFALANIGINIVSIVEMLKNSAFPIVLALGSILLTIMLIIVQLRKKCLIEQQLKNEVLETELKQMEIDKIKSTIQHDLPVSVSKEYHSSN